MLIDSNKTKSEIIDVGDDERFKTKENAFAVDPTHREFKKVT